MLTLLHCSTSRYKTLDEYEVAEGDAYPGAQGGGGNPLFEEDEA